MSSHPSGAPPLGVPAALTNADLAIFIVSLMENDNGDPEALRGVVKGIVGGSILGSLSSDRQTKVDSLIRDVDAALTIPTGAPNFDDKIGAPQELKFSAGELAQAQSGQAVDKTLVFEGDGGRFTLTFRALTFETQLRRFLTVRDVDLSRGLSLRTLQPGSDKPEGLHGSLTVRFAFAAAGWLEGLAEHEQ